MKRAFLPVILLLLTVTSNRIFAQDWKVLSDSAKIFVTLKDPAHAIEYYGKAKNILHQDSLNTDTYVNVGKSLADVYFSMSANTKAEPVYQEIKPIVIQLHTKTNAINADIADVLGQIYTSPDPQKAEEYFLEAKDVREKLFTKNSPAYASSCNSLGNLYNALGENEKAEALYLEAISIREQLLGKNDPSYAQSCNNLATVYRALGEFGKAEQMALEAKRIRAQLPPVKEHPSYAITCTNLANIYRDMGQYDKAEPLYIEALHIREKLPPVKEHLLYASSLNILADLYYYMNENNKAEALYIEARNIREKKLTRKSNEYAQSCNNLASLYRNMGQYQKAESLALEAKNIWDSILPPGHPNHAINSNNLGQLYYSMGEYDKAKTSYLEARQRWESALGKEHPYYFQNSASLAKVYWNINDAEKSDELYSEAFNSQYNQINKIFQFTNESEKEAYIKNVAGTSDEFQSFYFEKYPRTKAGKAYAMSLLNRNLILSSSQQLRQSIYQSGDTALNRQYDEWRELKQQLAKLYASGSTDAESIRETGDEADSIEKSLSRSSVNFTNLQKKINWQDLQKALKPNEVAIEFVQFQLYDQNRWTDSVIYSALILRKDKPEPIMVQLFEKKQLEELLSNVKDKQTIAQLYDGKIGSKLTTADGKSLYDLVWKPMEKYLTGTTRIFFAPAGDLFRISFAAIPVNAQQVLSDKFQLTQLNTTAKLTQTNKYFISPTDKIQLYGGVKYDVDSVALKQAVDTYNNHTSISRSLPDDLDRGSTFQYLPGTETEIEGIKKQATTTNTYVTVLSGVSASEESFKALNGASSPWALHIATHGFFFADPKDDKRDSIQKKFETSGKAFRQSDNPLLRSGLLFAGANNAWQGKFVSGIEDGIVTAYEVATTMYLPNTKLVVLSACETALGDIQGSEGVYGLQRAFKMAGVENLIMSLWKVPDAETSEFMQTFYKNLFAKQAIDDAFYHALQQMKNKYRKDPYKWAAWQLIR